MSGQSSTLTPAITKPDSPLAATEEQVNVSARHGVRFARRDEVDPDWRRQLTGLPFRARLSSRNGPVRLDQRFSEDPLPALLVEDDDAMQLRPPPAAQPLPSGRTHFRTPTRLE